MHFCDILIAGMALSFPDASKRRPVSLLKPYV